MKRGRQGRIAAWWAMRSQKRRRARNAVQPAAPVLLSWWCEWGGTDPGFGDAMLEFSFEHGSFAVAELEVWCGVGEGSVEFTLLATVESTAVDYRHVRVTEVPAVYSYKLRYRNGSEVGPFSEAVAVLLEPN